MKLTLCLALLGTVLQAIDAPASEILEGKAREFRARLMKRHIAREGIVLYRVNLDNIQRDLEIGNYPHQADTPTFTGQWAAAACTRASYAHGHEREEALGDAMKALAGMRFLMDVTGVRGLLARAVRRSPPEQSYAERGKWFDGRDAFAAYRWRGDVSMDQYANGLLPTIAACEKDFPEPVRSLAVDAASHLIDHDMRLVDPDGERTKFGDLSWRSGFGLNSLAQLTGYAIFSWAEQLDSDPRWGENRRLLRDRYRVGARSRRTNLKILNITNYSNELMSWSLYRALIPLARRTQDPILADLRHGVWRSWLRVRNDGNAFFTFSFCKLEPTSCSEPSVRQALELLKRFPLDKRKRELAPALQQLPRHWLPGRKFRPQARAPVPIALRPASSFEWKSSPYRLDASVDPDTSYSGLDYLAAYWLYRSLGLQGGSVAGR